MMCAFAVGRSISFFHFFVSARGRHTFFFFSIIIARRRNCYWLFFLSSPVGESS